jgi:hypothetical protein
MIFCTVNSTYEIDQEHHCIRRLEGRNQPTPRQGADGEWKHYAAVSPIIVGLPVRILWTVSEGTRLSPVREIVEHLH